MDGDRPATVPTLLSVQTGQPAPFDGSYNGGELFGGNDFDQSWVHNYSTTVFLTQTVTAATWTIGIAGHDSSLNGDQVAAATINGTDVASILNASLNATGGGVVSGLTTPAEYNLYTVDLTTAAFTDLTDGPNPLWLAQLELTLDAAAPGREIDDHVANAWSVARAAGRLLAIELERQAGNDN